MAGGVGAAGGTSAGGGGAGGSGGAMCQVDTGCKVSFKNDVYPALEGMGNCSFSPGCHGDGKGNLTLMPMAPDKFYTAITTYQMNHAPAVGPYIVPCDPKSSLLPCNLKVSDGANPHAPCGSTMPVVAAKAPTTKQLQAIEDWITCGAPNN